MRLVNFLLILTALAVSAGAAHIFFKAADVDPAELHQQQLSADIEKNLPLANKSDVRAQHRLGELYRTAGEPIRDYALAHKWYRKSADRGNTRSQYELGRMYAEGLGVRQNYHRAAEWYRLASNLSRHAGAQFSLGELYFNGRGVPSSFGVAIEWYTKAANQGHSIAQFYLGQIHKEGWGVDKDLVEAYKWLLLANRDRKRVLEHNDRNDPAQALKDLRPKMNSSQVKAAEQALKQWKPGR